MSARDADAGVAHATRPTAAPRRARAERDVIRRRSVYLAALLSRLRTPARAAPGRRRATSGSRRQVDRRARGRAPRSAGRWSRRARDHRAPARAARLRSSILPRVMRETSSRSSTSRTMCATWRSIIARACGRRRRGTARSRCSDLRPLRIGASGLRSSCASIARNSSLRRSVVRASRSRPCRRGAGGARDPPPKPPLAAEAARSFVLPGGAGDRRDAGQDAAELAQRLADLMPPLARRNSRMVRSCSPLRFFTTEIACRTSPAPRSSAAGSRVGEVARVDRACICCRSGRAARRPGASPRPAGRGRSAARAAGW